MSSSRPLKVFLCHARADQYAVRWLYYYLVDLEIDAWLDAEKLLAGQDWGREISKSIKNSDAIIICFSKDSINKEGYVQREIRYALDKALEMPLSGRLFLIPVRLDDFDVLPKLPEELTKLQYVNLFEENGCRKLLQSLESCIQQVGARPIADSTGESMREKTKQLAKLITREMRWKGKREPMQKPGNEEITPLKQIRAQLRQWKISVSGFGIFFTTLFASLALVFSWIAFSQKSLQPTLVNETSRPVFTVVTPTFTPAVIPSATENFPLSDTPAYTSTVPEETSTQVMPTQRPPMQATPTRIPPTQIPPTQIPPTQIPPTQTPTTPSILGGKLVFDSPVNGKWQVFSINPDGSELKQLTDISNGIGDPAISPDGQSIVFLSDNATTLSVMDADGTQVRNVYHTDIEVGWPSWSFNSQKILFAVKINGYKNLYIMNADGSNVRQLTDVSADNLSPSLSPDGSQILFTSNRSGTWEIYKLFVVSGEVIKLTSLGDPDQMWPSWSPDGSMIAFEASGIAGQRDIFTMYSDGTQIKNITNSSTYDGAPVWSPNGEKIAFASSRDGGLDIYIMENNGQQIRRLTTVWAWGPSWSFIK